MNISFAPLPFPFQQSVCLCPIEPHLLSVHVGYFFLSRCDNDENLKTMNSYRVRLMFPSPVPA